MYWDELEVLSLDAGRRGSTVLMLLSENIGKTLYT